MRQLIPGTGLLLLVFSSASAEVSESRVISETYAVNTQAPTLSISNIWGNVRVRPGVEGEISVTINETRSAPTRQLFDRSKEVLRLDIEADLNGLSIIVGDQTERWHDASPCRRCRVDYQFDVLVPPGSTVDANTVMDGKIDVAEINGVVSASNVNGPIAVAALQNCALLDSVNGAVRLSFAKAPDRNCAIETVNGDITLSLPDGSGLDVALDSFNGHMESEFSVDTFDLPAQIDHSADNGRNHYRIQQSAGLRLAGGGPVFSISSLNGDVRIQKSQ